MRHKPTFQYGVGILIGILLLGAVGSYWTSFANVIRLIVAGIFIFLLPGWCTTLFFFPRSERIMGDGMQEGEQKVKRQQRALDPIERTTLAVALSIIISSAVVFTLNVFSGDKFTPRNLAIAIVLTNFMLYGGMAWRTQRVLARYALPIILFPFAIIVLNWLGAVFTIRNFKLEVVGLFLVMTAIWIVTKRQHTRLNLK
ncbi:DUF1616 domain-containing protein [Candidatus Uhrbacteria bacterium]|nr:DUF1616 domain-containing protein [Candidatus Uhrbacteria bacterium]